MHVVERYYTERMYVNRMVVHSRSQIVIMLRIQSYTKNINLIMLCHFEINIKHFYSHAAHHLSQLSALL
jgi:hypothetical protein